MSKTIKVRKLKSNKESPSDIAGSYNVTPSILNVASSVSFTT